jgi:hypothetical protein
VASQLAVLTVALSWTAVNTIFTLRYADLAVEGVTGASFRRLGRGEGHMERDYALHDPQSAAMSVQHASSGLPPPLGDGCVVRRSLNDHSIDSDGWSGMGLVGVDSGPRCRDDFRMEGGDAAVVAELSAVAATVPGHVPELSSEVRALLTQDVPELRGDQIVEKLLDASGSGSSAGGLRIRSGGARHAAGVHVNTDRMSD